MSSLTQLHAEEFPFPSPGVAQQSWFCPQNSMGLLLLLNRGVMK